LIEECSNFVQEAPPFKINDLPTNQVLEIHLPVFGSPSQGLNCGAKIWGWLAAGLIALVVGTSSWAGAADTASATSPMAQIGAQVLRGFPTGATNLLRDTQLRLQHLVREPDPAEAGHDFECTATRFHAAQNRVE